MNCNDKKNNIIMGVKIPKFIKNYENTSLIEIKGSISEYDLNYDFKHMIYEYVYGKLENIFMIDIWNNRLIVDNSEYFTEDENYYYKKYNPLPELLKGVKFNQHNKLIFIECNSKYQLYAYILNKKFNGLFIK